MFAGMRVRVLSGLAAGIAILIPAASGQRPGAGPGTAGGPSGNLPRTAPGQTQGPDGLDPMNRGLYVSGRVMMEDGTAPPGPVRIERLCRGMARAQAYTDLKGRFSFQMGQATGVIQDASEEGANPAGVARPASVLGGGMGKPTAGAEMAMAGCELRAALAGFRSDTVDLTGRRLLDNPDVGTILLRRLANVEGSAISVTSLQAPKDARKAYDKGRQDLEKEKLPEAGKEFQRAVEIYPKYAAAWYELGRTAERQQDIEQARKAYANALAADPKFLGPYLQVMELDARAENWRAVVETTGRLLQLDPVDYPAAYFWNATAQLKLGNPDAAEKSARAGLRVDPERRYPKLDEVLAEALARKP